jgi:lauroyl/myristoyl acyltransferase
LTLAARAATALPPALDRPLSSLAGLAWWSVDARRRHAVGENRAALGARFAGHAPFARHGLALLGWLRLLGSSRASVRARTRVTGLATLHAARDAGLGTVLVAAHVGEWEWGAAALAARGLAVVAVAGVQMRADWSPALLRAKRDLGIEIVGPDASPTRLVRALKKGAVVALLVDGNVATARGAATIGGRTARLPLGPARLAALTGARLVAGRCERDFTARGVLYRVRLTPLDGDGSGPDAVREREARAFTAVADWLERTVVENAAAWCLFRPFFDPMLSEMGATTSGRPRA